MNREQRIQKRAELGKTRKSGSKIVQFKDVIHAAKKADPDVESAVGDFEKEMRVKMIMDRFYQYMSAAIGYKEYKISDIFTGITLPVDEFNLDSMAKTIQTITGMIVGTLPRVLGDPTPEPRNEIFWMLDETIFANQVLNLARITNSDNIFKCGIIAYSSAVLRTTYMTMEEADLFLAKVKALVPELNEEMLNEFKANCFGITNTEERFIKNRDALGAEIQKKYNVIFELKTPEETPIPQTEIKPETPECQDSTQM